MDALGTHFRSGWRHGIRAAVKHALDSMLPSRLFLCRGGRTDGSIALTFDDGPDPLRTPAIADILEKHGVRATFFVVGERVTPETAEILHRLAADGHEIACHRFTHRRLAEMTLPEFTGELERWRERVGPFRATDNTGRIPFRPPFGEVTAATMVAAWRCGYGVVLWSLESEDWRGASVEELIDRIHPRNVRDGEILVFHDTNPVTVEALARILPGLVDAGWRFVTISGMMAGTGARGPC